MEGQAIFFVSLGQRGRAAGFTVLLCLVGLLSMQAVGKNLRPAQDWLEKARLYREASPLLFRKILTALQMDVTEFANKSGQHEERLRSFMKGELFLDERELDAIEFFVNNVKDIVRRFSFDDPSAFGINSKARLLLYDDEASIDRLRKYLHIEATAQELQTSGEELTDEQQQLVNKVNTISNDAFARIEQGVSLAEINYYKNKEQTSAAILDAILALLGMSVSELALQSNLYAARVFSHQRGEIILSDEDIESINATLERATIPKPGLQKQLRSLVHKSKDERRGVSKELRLRLLLKDFKDAVRVERYLRDPRTMEQTTKTQAETQGD